MEQDKSRFRNLERRAADVIEIMTNVGMKYEESEAMVDVCQAIQDMRMESERNGELKKPGKRLEICMKWEIALRRFFNVWALRWKP